MRRIKTALVKNMMMARNENILALSRLLKIPYCTLNYWINGKTSPKQEGVNKMALHFGVAPEEICETVFTPITYVPPVPDPDLEDVTHLWCHLPPEDRSRIAAEVRRIAAENEAKEK